MLGDDDFIQDGKYRNYIAAMEKALKNFEYSSDWPDLISALTKLNKVISAHSKYKTVPRRVLLSKRLSQCLHPSLPSGVHLKALESYDLIFKTIGTEKLSADLFIYSSGLFPLLQYAGISVRPLLLKIYETYLLPLGENLVASLDGFLISILLGMEESSSSDTHQRTTSLLDSIKSLVTPQKFYTSLWECIQGNPKIRQPSIDYMLGASDRNEILIEDKVSILESIKLCLGDSNILVQRSSLELLSSTSDLCGEKRNLELIQAALKTLLRRDSSLNRRLFSWLSQDSDPELVQAIQCLLCADDHQEETFRVLVYLFDKSDYCERILDKVIVDIVRSLYIQNGPSSILRSANLFFSTLSSNHIWIHFFDLLRSSLKSEAVSSVQKPGGGPATVPELCLLLSFLIGSESTIDKSELTRFQKEFLELISNELETIPNLGSVLGLVQSFNCVNSELITIIYVRFVTKILYEFDLNSKYTRICVEELDVYQSDFQYGIQKSIQKMTEKFVPTVPVLLSTPSAESIECYSILNSIVSSSLANQHCTTNELLIQCLLVISTLSQIDSVKDSSISTLLNILDKCTVQYSTFESSEISVELITKYLYNRLPSSKSKIVQLHAHFPSRVERALVTLINTSDLKNIIDLLRDNKNSKFYTLVMKCLDNLESSNILLKHASEKFAREFMNTSIGILIDPILDLFERDFGNSAVSVLDFEGDNTVNNKKLEQESIQIESNNNSVKCISRTTSQNHSTCGNETVVDCANLAPSSSSSSPMKKRNVRLYLDNRGRFNIKNVDDDCTEDYADDEDEFEEVGSEFEAKASSHNYVDDEEMQIIEDILEEISKPSSEPPEITVTNCPAIDETSDTAETERPAPESHIQSDLNDRILTDSLANPDRDSMCSDTEESSTGPSNLDYKSLRDTSISADEISSAKVLDEDAVENIQESLLLTQTNFGESSEEDADSIDEDEHFSDSHPAEFQDGENRNPSRTETPNPETADLESSNELNPFANLLLDDSYDASVADDSNGTRKPNNNRLFSIHPYNTSFYIYLKSPDHSRVLYGLQILRNLMRIDTRSFLVSLSTTNQSSSSQNTSVTYLELLLDVLLKMSQCYYTELPSDGDVGYNLSLHVEGLRLIGTILNGLVEIVKGNNNNKGYQAFVGDLLHKLHVQRTVLYTLSSLVLLDSEPQLTSTEELLKSNYCTSSSSFELIYGELASLSSRLITLEYSIIQFPLKTKIPPSNKYIPNLMVCRQPLYLEYLLKTITSSEMVHCHILALTSVTNSLPYYGGETGRIVSRVVEAICGLLKGSESGRQSSSYNASIDYISRILESLTSLTHFVLLEHTNTIEKDTPQSTNTILFNLVSAFLPAAVVGTSAVKEKDSLSPTSTLSKPSETNRSQLLAKSQLLTLLPQLLSTLLSLWSEYPVLKQTIITLINPIAFSHLNQFILAIGKQDLESIHGCVELVHEMSVVSIESLANGILGGLRSMEAEDDQVVLLKFLSSYIDRLSGKFSEIFGILLSLLRDGLTGYPLRPQLILLSICSKIGSNGLPSGKQELKELQDVTWKLIDAISSNNSSTDKKYRRDLNLQLEVLECLNINLVPIVDSIWNGDLEKVLPLVTNVVYNVLPHLRSRFPLQHYTSTASLVSHLSSQVALRKSWKKDIFELLLESNFLTFPKECFPYWRITFDNLFTQDKSSFTELLARVSVPQTGSLNIFTSKEVEYESRAMLLKRLALVLFCSPRDSYTKFMTSIQERLAEAIKMPLMIPIIQSSVFLCFRVLLMRLSPQHLHALWPIILHEVLQVLIQMETDILTRNPNLLQLYLQMCKLLELALNLPSTSMPMFTMYRWSFIGPAKAFFTPHLTRLASLVEPQYSPHANGFNALRSNKIEHLGQLYDFLKNPDIPVDVQMLENGIESDFITLE